MSVAEPAWFVSVDLQLAVVYNSMIAALLEIPTVLAPTVKNSPASFFPKLSMIPASSHLPSVVGKVVVTLLSLVSAPVERSLIVDATRRFDASALSSARVAWFKRLASTPEPLSVPLLVHLKL